MHEVEAMILTLLLRHHALCHPSSGQCNSHSAKHESHNAGQWYNLLLSGSVGVHSFTGTIKVKFA